MVNDISYFFMNELKEKSNSGHTAFLLIFSVLFGNLESLGQMPQLFTEEVLKLTLSGDLKTVFKDHGDDSQYQPAELFYFSDQKKVSIPLKIKSRLNFRKSSSNCKYPPLMLNFPHSEFMDNMLFSGQKR